MNELKAKLLLAQMENANAWLAFAAAQSTNDLQHYGFWRVDYEASASVYQRQYEEAEKALKDLLEGSDQQ